MIKIKPLLNFFSSLNLGLVEKMKTTVYYIGAYNVLKNIAKFLGYNDGQTIGKMVILAMVADKITDEYGAVIKMVDNKIIVDGNCPGSLTELLIELVSSLNLDKELIEKVLIAQELSKLQKQINTELFLFIISSYKGCVTAQLHARVFGNNDMDDACVAGAFIQLFDDWLDVNQDKKEGINTLFTTGLWSYNNLKDFYEFCISVLNDKYKRIVKYIWKRRYIFKIIKRMID